MSRRTNVGFHIVTNGRTNNPFGWDEFTSRVMEAAAKKRTNRGDTSNLKRDPATLWGQPIPDDKRCSFVNSKNARKGVRCGNWAMKGGKLCRVHGGYRENPEHPATVKQLPNILRAAEGSAAYRETRTADPKLKQQVIDTLEGLGLATSNINIRDGLRAIVIDDGGKAYRRWIAQVQKMQPVEGKRARKTKLRSQR